MRRIPYWHVDAFSAKPSGGNPAAVMLLEEGLGDAQLQAIAAENGLPATAFVRRDHTGDADFEICWFSPNSEIALCGHGTLAAGHFLLNRERAAGITFRTRHAGLLEVRRLETGVELNLPAIVTTPSTQDEAVSLLGVQALAVYSSVNRHHICLFEDEAMVRAIRPNFAKLAQMGDDQFICTAPGAHSDIVSRVFVPGVGNDEDSVTGSAHAALTPFWVERLGRTHFTAHQASARGGDLTCRLEGDRVWIGGACTTVVEGTFLLE